jgi:type I restriction enzyme, R subunit
VSVSSEGGVVQYPLVEYGVEAGWTLLSPADALALRGGEASPVLIDVLVAQLQQLNPGIVDSARAAEVAKALVRVRPSIEGNLDTWEYLAGLKTVFVPDENRERNIRLLDVERDESNTFHVTAEYRFTNGKFTIRPDVVFLVNGVPVLIVEAKAATKQDGIAAAMDQLRRYHREGPELLAILQVQTAVQLTRFFYGATWAFSRKVLFDWRDEAAGEDYEALVKSFVDPQRILRVLTDFIIFTRTDGELQKVLLRPHQMRAIDKVVERAVDGERARGLVWHTQGSGKTFTMISAAKKLIESRAFENPTILMLVDRNELEAQLFGNLEALGFVNVQQAETKVHLKELLSSDYRGLIVSTIHKFERMPANINTRSNVVVLVDEAHRSTGGDLGNYLMGALPNATYIGFTGTPVDKTAYGKGTFKVFGGEDAKGYLDKYSIKQSIADGTTLPLHYSLAPNELRVDREVLEREFLSLADAEGVSDIEELDRVLTKAVTLRNMLKNPDRVDRVAAYAAGHFRSNVEPSGYKAFLVGVDREACCLYKEALDRYLPSEYSKVVISAAQNDSEHISRYHLGEGEERVVRKSFRKPDEMPSVLIVTEKLLTGFDAPILETMYLDKPMRDHVLLQAIARVNRPYEDELGRRKSAGFILDFVGVFERLERALAFDSEDVSGVIEDLDLLRREWERMVERARSEYLPIAAGLTADKKAEAMLEYFRDEEVREVFYGFYGEMQEVYEVLSPDAFLRPFMGDYEQLAEMYRLLRVSFDSSADVDNSFLRKTAELVREQTRSGRILDPTDVYVLNENAIELLADSDKPDTVKVFNLLKVIEQMVRERANMAPYLVPIGQRAEEVARKFYERQIDSQDALEQLTLTLEDARTADRERADTKLSLEGFVVYWVLKGMKVANPNVLAEQMESAFAKHPYWKTSKQQESELRARMYKVLLGAGVENNVVDVVGGVLDLLKR